MAEFTVEITGEHGDHLAQELQECLTANQGKAQVFAETERGVDLVTTPLLCFAIAGVNVILLGPIPSFG